MRTTLRSRFLAGAATALLLLYGGRFLVNETIFADLIVAPLLVADSEGRADAIVVAGAGVTGECLPNSNGIYRTLAAARLWKAERAPYVLFTGGEGAGPCPIAVAMSRFAREVGVPASALLIETGSRSTRENAELSAATLRRIGARRLLLVTDQLHMRRAGGVFEALGFDVGRHSVPIYLGHDDNVGMLAAGLREMAALAAYRGRGWLGPATAGPVYQHESLSEEEVNERVVVQPMIAPGQPVAVLGASYAAGWTPGEIAGTPIVNLGIGGQRTQQMLERFETDVVRARPQAVILWGFINDLFASAPQDEQAKSGVRERYLAMIALARKHGIQPILATEVTVRPAGGLATRVMSLVAPLLGKESYQDRINRDVLELNGWLVDLARRENLVLLDLQSTLAEAGGRRRSEYTLEDGSHLTAAAYDAITAHVTPIFEDLRANPTNGVLK